MEPNSARKLTLAQKLRAVICIAVILCYIAGIILMILNHFSEGLLLWVISTLAGIGILYYIRTNEKKEADLKQQEAEEAERRAGKQE